MSIVDQLHAEHKARLIRLGGSPHRKSVNDVIETINDIKGEVVAERVSPMQRWIDQYEPLPEPTYPTVQRIKERVSEHFGISIIDLDSARRTADTVMPRHIAMYLVRNLTPRSFPDIAKKFGRRDHTTAIHAVHKIERLLKSDANLAATVDAIRNRISGSNV